MADKRNNPSNYALVIVSEGAAEWEGYTVKEYGRRRPRSAIAKKMSVGRGSEQRDQGGHRRGDDRERPDLRAALRQPGLSHRMVASTFADMAVGCHPRGQAKSDDRRQRRPALPCSRFPTRRSSGRRQGGCGHDVQHRALPPRLYDRKLGLPIFLTPRIARNYKARAPSPSGRRPQFEAERPSREAPGLSRTGVVEPERLRRQGTCDMYSP